MKQAKPIEVFDVVLLGFDDGGLEAPAAGLQRVFGIDERAAERVLANLPTTVQRGVSAVRATYFMRALALIGGRAETRDRQGLVVDLQADNHPDTVVDPQPAGSLGTKKPATEPTVGPGVGSKTRSADETSEQDRGTATTPSGAPGGAFATGRTRLQVIGSETAPSSPAPSPGVLRTQLAHASEPLDPAPAPGPALIDSANSPGHGAPQRTLMWGSTDANPGRTPMHGADPAYKPTQHGGAQIGTRASTPAQGAPASDLKGALASSRLPRHASTLGKDVLDVLDVGPDGGGTRRVSLGDDRAEHGPSARGISAALLDEPPTPSPDESGHRPEPGAGLAKRACDEGWKGLPPPLLTAAEIARRWPRAAQPQPQRRSPPPRDQPRQPEPGVDPQEGPTGMSLAGEDANLSVMGAWEQPGSATAQRYQHPVVPQGIPLMSPRDMGALSDLAPSAGPSYRPHHGGHHGEGPVSAGSSFWESIGHGLTLPFLGTGTLWIVGMCVWSILAGALTAAAARLPNHLVLASLVISVLAGSSLVAFSADFFRACFWAVLEGKGDLDRAPSASPARFLDQYVIGGFHLIFFAVAAAVPVGAWGFWILKGSGTAEDLMRSPVTWGLILFPFAYWPMALSTAAVGQRLSAVWMLGPGLMAIMRAPLAYLTVVGLGALAFTCAGAVFAILGKLTGQPWIITMSAGFPVAIGAGIEGALMGHVVRANPDLFD